MKKIKKIEEDGFYAFVGRSNANSCFIEKLQHAKCFLVYANYFLKNYLTIYDYIITKDGWSIVVKINSLKEIEEIEDCEDVQVWRVISERVRLFLSTFVRVTNRDKGRTGCLVHSSYERYFFEGREQALGYMKGMRKQKLKFYAKKKKYRGLKSHYKVTVSEAEGSVFLCSRELKNQKRKVEEIGEVFDFIGLSNLVVEKMVNLTKFIHNTSNSRTNHSKSLFLT